MVIFGVGFEVGGQLVDASGQQSDLNFWATGVFGCTRIGGNDFGLDGLSNHLISFVNVRSTQPHAATNVIHQPNWASNPSL
jgi:hypothetical protein